MVSYRPNVAALILNPKGKLLVCERLGSPGAWQFPQGGADPGESLKQALYREVREEVGLKPKEYTIVRKETGYRYLYPKDVREKKLKKHGNHGQEQTYYLCQLVSKDSVIDVHQNPPEFSDYMWIKPYEFDIEWLPKFKHDVYREVMRDFFDVEI